MSRSVISFWTGLQKRERLTIISGSMLVLAVAVYLIFNTLWQSRAELVLQRDALMQERAWMEEQSGMAQQLENACRENQILALGSRELIELLASRNQVSLETVNMDGASLSLQVNSDNGNNILRFIFQSACQGYSLTQLQIDSAGSGAFVGRLGFRHES